MQLEGFLLQLNFKTTLRGHGLLKDFYLIFITEYYLRFLQLMPF